MKGHGCACDDELSSEGAAAVVAAGGIAGCGDIDRSGDDEPSDDGADTCVSGVFHAFFSAIMPGDGLLLPVGGLPKDGFSTNSQHPHESPKSYTYEITFVPLKQRWLGSTIHQVHTAHINPAYVIAETPSLMIIKAPLAISFRSTNMQYNAVPHAFFPCR